MPQGHLLTSLAPYATRLILYLLVISGRSFFIALRAWHDMPQKTVKCTVFIFSLYLVRPGSCIGLILVFYKFPINLLSKNLNTKL